MITVTYLLDDGSSDWTYSVKKNYVLPLNVL